MALTPDLILCAYAQGAFPMAETRDSPDQSFFQPIDRGVFPLDKVRVSSRLRRFLRKRPFDLKIDQDFDQVVTACAEVPRRHEAGTWINDEIKRVFCELHATGHAHCIGAYDDQGNLVGGLYGLHQGRIFFGESMFSTATNASKACLVGLFAVLLNAGFAVVDAQMPNAHLAQFGLDVWPNEMFLDRLPGWLATQCPFPTAIDQPVVDQFLQSTTQTS